MKIETIMKNISKITGMCYTKSELEKIEKILVKLEKKENNNV